MNTLPPTGATERQLHQAIKDLIEGRSNATGTVTLTVDATETTVTKSTINRDAVVILTPQTATAAAATYHATVASVGGAFTVTHDASSATDRTFGYLVIGG